MKCKATGMMNKWVVSAYKIKEARNKKSLTTSTKLDNKRSNGQENDLSWVEKRSETIAYKYDMDSTQKLIEEMNRKYMLSNDIDKKVRIHVRIIVIVVVTQYYSLVNNQFKYRVIRE